MDTSVKQTSTFKVKYPGGERNQTMEHLTEEELSFAAEMKTRYGINAVQNIRKNDKLINRLKKYFVMKADVALTLQMINKHQPNKEFVQDTDIILKVVALKPNLNPVRIPFTVEKMNRGRKLPLERYKQLVNEIFDAEPLARLRPMIVEDPERYVDLVMEAQKSAEQQPTYEYDLEEQELDDLDFGEND
jgi:hypothetical protein